MKKAIRYILLTVCVCVFCYSAYNLVNIYLNYKKIDDDYGEIAKDYTKETDPEEKESIISLIFLYNGLSYTQTAAFLNNPFISL